MTPKGRSVRQDARMADAPTWTDIVGAASTAATAAAVLIGGIVGYNRYLRRRDPHAKCDLELAAKVVRVDGANALLVNAAVKNAGSCRLRFSEDLSQKILVGAAFRSTWIEATQRQEPPKWGSAIIYVEDLLKNDAGEHVTLELEPGQRFVRALLLPAPLTKPQAVAYRASLSVAARPLMVRRAKEPCTWSTECITAAEGQQDG